MEDAFQEYEECLEEILRAARENGYEILILGDYEIEDAFTPLYPNRMLAENGYLSLSENEGALYPDFYLSLINTAKRGFCQEENAAFPQFIEIIPNPPT